MTSLALVSPKEELIEHEHIIERGLGTFVEIGKALKSIKDKRLYRNDYNTFEEYCRSRWNWSRVNAYRQISAYETHKNLSPIGYIRESWIRPIIDLKPDEQKQVWQMATESAPKGKLSARHIAKTVDAFKEADGSDIPSNVNSVDPENIDPEAEINLERITERLFRNSQLQIRSVRQTSPYLSTRKRNEIIRHINLIVHTLRDSIGILSKENRNDRRKRG